MEAISFVSLRTRSHVCRKRDILVTCLDTKAGANRRLQLGHDVSKCRANEPRMRRNREMVPDLSGLQSPNSERSSRRLRATALLQGSKPQMKEMRIERSWHYIIGLPFFHSLRPAVLSGYLGRVPSKYYWIRIDEFMSFVSCNTNKSSADRCQRPSCVYSPFCVFFGSHHRSSSFDVKPRRWPLH
jgi:hypothetical protein